MAHFMISWPGSITLPALGYLNNLVSVSESHCVQYFPSHTTVKGSSSVHLLLEV